MTAPVFLLVDGADDALGADLERRFGRDYRIAREDTVDDGDRVALVFGDTVEALERLHARFPGARRVLLVDRGDWSAGHPAIAAMALGRIDFHLYRPWRPLERILYPAVSEFLAAWDAGEEPPAVALRIAGDRDAARSHELRDVLSRVAIPYWFHDATSAEGRALIAETGATRLPVVALFDGTVLENPSHADLMTALGMRSRPDGGRYDVAIVGAGPAGLAAAVYAASEGLRTVVLEPVVPGGQAGTSSLIRNYLGFQRGVSGSDLANRAVEQAWLFGAEFVMDQQAHRALHGRRGPGGDDGRRLGRDRADGRAGHRRRVAAARRAGAGGPRRRRCLLRRGRRRGPRDDRQGRVRGRRRQLRRAGGRAPGPVRRLGDDGGARRRPGPHDVGLPGDRDR